MEAALPFIHRSGADAFGYVFWVAGGSDIHAFLRQAFVDGGAEFGWRNHVVGVTGDALEAVAADYAGDTKWRCTPGAARQILSHHGARHAAEGYGWSRLLRNPPEACTIWINWVSSRSCGSKAPARHSCNLMLQAAAQRPNRPVMLNVATTNDKAQQLYQRPGFEWSANDDHGLPMRNAWFRIIAGGNGEQAARLS